MHFETGSKDVDLENVKSLQPLEAPMAAIRDKLVTQSTSLARHCKELQASLEVICFPSGPFSSLFHIPLFLCHLDCAIRLVQQSLSTWICCLFISCPQLDEKFSDTVYSILCFALQRNSLKEIAE